MIADTGINRFIRAQENIYPQAVNELQNGGLYFLKLKDWVLVQHQNIIR